MKKITDPIKLAHEISRDYQACYGSDLVSVVLYGSGAGSHFDPLRSDVNLLIVLTTTTLPMLEKSLPIQERWLKQRCARPLFMDKAYIAGSLDTFPIEFLDMQGSHKVIYGEDLLSSLIIKPEHLRHQIEHQLKGRRLHLLSGWLEARSHPRLLSELIRASLADFAPVFRALLHLKSEPVPRDRMGLLLAIQTAFRFDNKAFQLALESLRTRDKNQMRSAFPVYAEGIDRLITIVDRLITTKEEAV